MTKSEKSIQSHGESSTVYVPILKFIFNEKYISGQDFIEFTLDDVRAASTALGIIIRNAPDLIYRMRSRTISPQEIQDEGFRILRSVGRGRYRLENGESTILKFQLIQFKRTYRLTLSETQIRLIRETELVNL